jgi:hypothetical protein
MITTTSAPADTDPRRLVRHSRLVTGAIFVAISLVALAGFAWPFVLPASRDQSTVWVAVIVCLLVPILAIIAVIIAERGVTGSPDAAKFVAMLGLLAAAGAVVRLFASAAGGIEAVFVILIIGGAVFGPRFGFLLGAVTIGVSALALGLLGPWVGFQMFAAAWVGAGAGLVSRGVRRLTRRASARHRRWSGLGALAIFGVIAAYAYGALLNLWFWPFAVGGDTSISYVAGADTATNVSHFFVYTLVTSTATWDTVRAVTTVIGLIVLGPAIMAGLRRSKLGR